MRSLTRMEDDRGVALIEFALVLPILITLLLGLIEGAWALNQQLTLQHAAREAVRVHALGSGDPTTVAADAAAPTVTGVSVTTTGCTRGQPTSATVSATYQDLTGVVTQFSGIGTLSARGVMRCER